MQLALFLPELRDGGAERVMLDLANGFAAAGHGVDLLAGRIDPAMAGEATSGVSVQSLGTGRLAAALFPLVRYLRSRRAEALLTTLGGANVLAPIARGLAGTRIRLVLREANTPGVHGLADPSIRGRILRALSPWAYTTADAVVAVSAGVRTDLCRALRVPESKVRVIFNPVITPRLRALASVPLVDPWFEPGAPPVITGMGRLTPQKDFGTLVRAFGRIRGKVNARLLILGEGEERPQLQSLVSELGLEDEVRLPGQLKNPFPYLVRSHVFVLSSRWEGLPNSLIQALGCGCLVVSTNCPSGPSEILKDGELGPLVPVGQADSMARAILQQILTARREGPQFDDPALSRFGADHAVHAYLGVLAGPQAASSR